MAKKILVVDDEADVRSMLKELLSSAGYEVTTAKDGKDALDKLKKKKFDLALLDFFMPGMSGRELLEKIRADKELQDLKCAFLTVATFSTAGEQELIKLRSLDYIRKPFSPKELLKRIKRII